MMFDLLIRNARLIDGTGAPARAADVGVIGDRIAEIGILDKPAQRTIDAGGQVLAPGFIDVHTHYDAQVFWDPTLSPSCQHGVTTVFAGNCGFSIAPLSQDSAPYLLRMLARVEGIPESTLKEGVPWNWESFAEYLGRLEGRIGVNMGFMCGHSAIRRYVMGARALHAQSTPEELERMKALLATSLSAGAMGFSTTVSPSHNDADGRPVPSRFASVEELVELARVCRDYPGTTLEMVPGVSMFGDYERDLMTQMSLAAERSLNWNTLPVVPNNEDYVAHQLAVTDHARAAGAEIIALVISSLPSGRFNFHSGFVFDMLPGWAELFELPVPQRIEAFKDPDLRRELARKAKAMTTEVYRGMAQWETYIISHSGDESLEGQTVGEVAERQGKPPLDAMLDIAIADGLRTVFMRAPMPNTEELWRRREALWRDDRTVIGASDAGAHLDMIDSFSNTTSLLAAVRDNKVLTLEEAVHYITQRPADLLGLKDRGVIKEGWRADLVIFDPETVKPSRTVMRNDLPGDEMRVFADAEGIRHVIVNGCSIIEDGVHTGALPGEVLRSGRDTETRKPKTASTLPA